MRYVIIRDDDTNAFTPPECLERLYRPFLDRGLPVNLATIPEVTTAATMADGQPEGFLPKSTAPLLGRASRLPPGRLALAPTCTAVETPASLSEPIPPREDGNETVRTVPIGANPALTRYLLDNPGYRIVQHGCHHDWLEFDRPDSAEIARRLERGTRRLTEAGFSKPLAFVAPYDRLSPASYKEVAKRFRVLSTGWYELRRLPYAWWPWYALKKARATPHWRVGRMVLLSHPGCLLSYQRSYSTMLDAIERYLNTWQLTVLVTHWWEYFRDGQPDEPFINRLHETADRIATDPQLKAISFDDLADGNIRL